MKRLFIFDYDGVMAHYDWPKRLAHLAALAGVPAQKIEKLFAKGGVDDAADRGEFRSSKDYLAALGKELGYPLTKGQWIENRRIAMTPWVQMLDVVRRCQALGRTILLTDNGPLFKEALPQFFPQVPATFGRENLFFSSDHKSLKSEPQTFVRLLQRLGFGPAQTQFIDDRPDYVAAARQVGIKATLAKSFEPTLRFPA